MTRKSLPPTTSWLLFNILLPSTCGFQHLGISAPRRKHWKPLGLDRLEANRHRVLTLSPRLKSTAFGESPDPDKSYKDDALGSANEIFGAKGAEPVAGQRAVDAGGQNGEAAATPDVEEGGMARKAAAAAASTVIGVVTTAAGAAGAAAAGVGGEVKFKVQDAVLEGVVSAVADEATGAEKKETSKGSPNGPATTDAIAAAAAAVAVAGEESEVTHRPFQGVLEDMARRRKFYRSDWTDGFQTKTISAVLLLYVACLAPTVSFGGLCAVLTEGQIGVVEFLISHGVSGVLYAVFSGQPMTFIAPTGLTTAFMAALFRFADLSSLPFLPCYGWVGLWTAGMLAFLSIGGFAQLIKKCTTFTDDVFNALLALTFLVEAMRSLAVGFVTSGADKTSAFLAFNFALFTCFASLRLSETRRSKLFNKSIREAISDFGPILVILTTSLLSLLPVFKGLGMEFLTVPAAALAGSGPGQALLSGGRDLLVPLLEAPVWARWAAALPASLLTLLFYCDHLISVRVVNKEKFQCRKGAAYNLDLLALSGLVGLQSVCGLPWMCGATVQSLNHLKAMASYGTAPPEAAGGEGGGNGGGTGGGGTGGGASSASSRAASAPAPAADSVTSNAMGGGGGGGLGPEGGATGASEAAPTEPEALKAAAAAARAEVEFVTGRGSEGALAAPAGADMAPPVAAAGGGGGAAREGDTGLPAAAAGSPRGAAGEEGASSASWLALEGVGGAAVVSTAVAAGPADGADGSGSAGGAGAVVVAAAVASPPGGTKMKGTGAKLVRSVNAMAEAFVNTWNEDEAKAAKVVAATQAAEAEAAAALEAERREKEKARAEEEGEVITGMVETRLSGVVLHTMLFSSVLLLPVLQLIPMPVIYGIFLYLGRKVMMGNEFLGRISTIFYDREKLPPDSAVTLLGRKKVAQYVGIQAGCLALLWGLKSFKPTAIFFPSVIGGLIVMRLKVLPRIFSKKELDVLDAAI